MKRIGQSQAARSEQQAWQARTNPAPRAPGQAGQYQPGQYQPGQYHPGQYQPGQAQPGADEPGSLFRPHRAKDQP
jgi:hypothetical protein